MFLNTLKNDLLKTNCIFSLTKCCSSLMPNVNNLENNVDSDSKLLRVCIIGIPNSGKSTLINHLMDRKVCPTSSKVHTTRAHSRAIFTQGDAQIVFVDTPGLVNINEKNKFNLERSFVKDSKEALAQTDIVGVIHDVSNVYTREKLDIKVIKLLEFYKEKPSLLILNKIDVLKSKRKLLDITRLLTDNCIGGKPIPGPKPKQKTSASDKDIRGWPYFKDIFMVSALTGSGLSELQEYFRDNAKPAKWLFPEKIWTDRSAEEIIENTVKAKLLDFLPQEIPYALKVQIEYFDINSAGTIITSVLVKCPSPRISRLVAGISDGRLRQIMQSVQADLQNAFQNFVRINIVLDPPSEPSKED